MNVKEFHNRKLLAVAFMLGMAIPVATAEIGIHRDAWRLVSERQPME